MYDIKLFICLFSSSVAAFLVHGQKIYTPPATKENPAMKVDSLKPVIVSAAIRPHIKGDTLEYNVEKMIMQPNAVVEDLLRRLPGLHIDFNGNITYNGEKIEHLLVDGQDIFGSEPTLVTRNFDASKIARVQILDRKSDHSIFTGIDDGSRTKTINLELKESAKNGYFGKAEAGGNTSRYYNTNGMLAAFRDKEQLTATGSMSNTGNDNRMGIWVVSPDPLGTSAGAGIPRTSAAAFHYANTSNHTGDQLEANGDYSHYFTRPVTSSQSLQTQSDSVYGQSQQSQSVNSRDMQGFNSVYQSNPNQNSSFRLALRGSNTREQNQFGATGTSTFNDTLVNSSTRTIQDQRTKKQEEGNIGWKMRIGTQPSQVLSATAAFRKKDEITDGYLYALDRYYSPAGGLQSADTVDERKQIISHAWIVYGTVNYTQPLWKQSIIGVTYGLSLNADRPLQTTYDKGHGDYTQVVDSLSSHLVTQTFDRYLAVNLQGKTRHLSYTLSNTWQEYSYHQQDLIADSTLHVQYTNWAPKCLLNYTPNPITNIGLQYNATTQDPSIVQLAPIKNNNNPLFIILGNPNLKPSLTHAFKIDFHRTDAWLINVSLNTALVNNSISTRTTTDSLGKQTSQPANVDGRKTAALNLSVSRTILGLEAECHAGGSFMRSVNYVNADLSRNNAYSGSGGVSLGRYIANRYNFQLTTNLGYFDEISSVDPAAPIHYWTQNYSGAVGIWLIPQLELGTNANYTWQGKAGALAGTTSVLLWNSYVSRNFLHNKLVVKAQFNNMLNQNTGISRSNSANINTAASTNMLGRYWMMSLIYHFENDFKPRKATGSIKSSPHNNNGITK